MTPYYEDDGLRVFCGDALTVMRSLPAASVDLIATDPPYFRVKNEPWDRAWDSTDGFLAWVGDLCDEWRRLLKPNGSLYVFASPKMARRVGNVIAERFHILTDIRWAKAEGRHRRAAKAKLRSYFPASETIWFAEHYGADSMAMGEAGYAAKCEELRGFVFEPLRAYLDGERRRAGVDKADCNAACGFSRSAGGMASRHYFSRSQWRLPTREHYESLQALFNAHANGSGPVLTRPYEDLRRQYEELRRPFNVTADVPYTDTWTFPTVAPYPGKHPCEKPLAMMEHIVRASSRPGAVVLDCFAGSGTTLAAARNLGRNGIGIDLSERWCRRTVERATPALPLFADGAA